jgi:hypothetical protein
MLYKCIRPGLPLWQVEFDTLSGRLEHGDIVIDMGEQPKPRGITDARPYLKVFYNGTIGWVLRSSLVPLEESRASK